MEEDKKQNAVIVGIYFLTLFVVLIIAFCGCTSQKNVVIERIKTDSIYLHTTKYDSIYIKDSIFIRERADGSKDTEHFRTEKGKSTIHDTIRIEKSDTIPVIEYIDRVKTEKVVPKFMIWCTIFFWLLVLYFIVRTIIKIYAKLR